MSITHNFYKYTDKFIFPPVAVWWAGVQSFPFAVTPWLILSIKETGVFLQTSIMRITTYAQHQLFMYHYYLCAIRRLTWLKSRTAHLQQDNTILALPAAGVNNECTSECLSKGAPLERCAHYQCPMLIGVQLHNNKGTLCDKPALGVIARPLRLIQ
jgi:hypothetical protein